MKKLFLASAFALGMLVTSCASLTTKGGMGVLYTGVSEGEAVTANTLGKKVGTAEITNILGLVTTGDASIQTAAKNAGITRISHIDCKKTSVIGVYGKYTVYVYGD